jgi:16S rRNA (guanine1207-N2)-methyltransferase
MPHYYDAAPAGEERHDQATLHIDGRDFSFVTSSGVFASHRVDFGTQLLLETVIEQIRSQSTKSGRLLDLGCGYGVVGVVMKRFFPAMDVVMADVNARAIRLAGENASRNQVSFAQIVQSDGFTNLEGMFDHILTNPPVRAGKAVVHSFFDGAYKHLVPGGCLYVVLQKKQGAPSAATYLEALFGNCTAIAKSAGFRVLRCQR